MVIVPEPGRHKEIGQLLLGLVSDPYQVKWVTYPKAGFQIPADLLPEFEFAMADLGESYPEPAAPKTFVDADTDLGALKKRGRPKKSAPAKAAEGEK